MEQLRLVAVHDDGEHLIVETPDSTRYRLKIDQQLRQTIQHTRRKPPARGRGASSFGPRDIQARFRAGASVDDVVAESGWEPERVKRYEWPILAERSHMVTEACRVTVSGTNPSHDGYRSVFEGEPKTLEETVSERAPRLGVDRASFDWDAWLREDHLWTVQLSFTVTDHDAAGPGSEGPAQWSYNPVTRSVRPENEWAHALGEEPRETGPLGAAAPAAPVSAPSPQLRQLQHEASQADELLDVLQSRRGRRLGTDEDGDDRLAEILGRGMGQVEQRPRPIDAPVDSPVFDRPIQPAASQVAEAQALQQDGIEIVDDSTPVAGQGSGTGTPAAQHDDAPEGTVHTDAPQPWVDVTETEHDTEDDSRGGQSEPHSSVTPLRGRAEQARQDPAGADGEADRADPAETSATAGSGGETTPEHTGAAGSDGQDGEGDSAATPAGPRGRTPKAKRSSVPSWDDIVFGANRS
ncbi:DUF3071 domain-containing protein [Kocuria tytonicola]|uniref:septation protein SepH n=1 Tax=Kocuria tytonicola TaxID=2055946 RepID=UPI000EF8D23F|nr:septation protein SepH [Kocuria tytonicola]RLZ02382.1 DUF3071 domain-containing protein [Kocuria tytonicola]